MKKIKLLTLAAALAGALFSGGCAVYGEPVAVYATPGYECFNCYYGGVYYSHYYYHGGGYYRGGGYRGGGRHR